jgi:RimJ/RimL family protein N-acetyltransferase
MEMKDGNIRIRRATTDDAATLCKWWNDDEIMRYAGFPNGWNISEQEIRDKLAGETDETAGRWIIEIDNEPCGEMVYENKENNVVQIGAKMCAPALNEKGYGARALKMLMKHLLETMG